MAVGTAVTLIITTSLLVHCESVTVIVKVTGPEDPGVGVKVGVRVVAFVSDPEVVVHKTVVDPTLPE
jgi:hypothetical protein